MARDRATPSALEAAGWTVAVIWQCSAATTPNIWQQLARFVTPARLGDQRVG